MSFDLESYNEGYMRGIEGFKHVIEDCADMPEGAFKTFITLYAKNLVMIEKMRMERDADDARSE